jgi:TPR repeat protein
MLKTLTLSLSTIFLFSACSFKMPSFEMPSFLTFGEDKIEISLTQANICQEIKNEDEKLSCYIKIEEKNSFAQIRLGTYYADKKDYTKALKYLNKAKENDNIYANLPLAFLYYKAEGVQKNIDKSFELLKDASSKDPTAAYQLSRFYLQGINTKIDNEEGVELLEFAASKGVSTAQEMLINVYKNGLFEQARDQKKVEYWQKKLKENIEDTNHKIYRL